MEWFAAKIFLLHERSFTQAHISLDLIMARRLRKVHPNSRWSERVRNGPVASCWGTFLYLII
jgi:hypothetical protein